MILFYYEASNCINYRRFSMRIKLKFNSYFVFLYLHNIIVFFIITNIIKSSTVYIFEFDIMLFIVKVAKI